jgi:hypothetical protein
MGLEWDCKDPDRRIGPTPKLTMAGRLDGEVDGRPVSLSAERQTLVFSAKSVRTLLTLRRSWRSMVEPLRALLTRSDVRLLVRVGWLGSLEVLPHPSYLVRRLLPRW